VLAAIDVLKPLKKLIEEKLLNYLVKVVASATGLKITTWAQAMELLEKMALDPGQYLDCGLLYSERDITTRLDKEMGNYGSTIDTTKQTFQAFYQCLNMCKLCLIGPENLNAIIQNYNPKVTKRYAAQVYPRAIRQIGIQIKTKKNNYNPFSSAPSTCGTDDNVYFGVQLKNEAFYEMIMDTPGHNDFENNQVDNYVFKLPVTIRTSDIQKFTLRKDYIKISDDWMPEWITLTDDVGNLLQSTPINQMIKGRTPFDIKAEIPEVETIVAIDPSIISFLYSLDGAGHGPENPTTELQWNNPGFPFYADKTLRETVFKQLFETPCIEKQDLKKRTR
jgi:hypothetical protein